MSKFMGDPFDSGNREGEGGDSGARAVLEVGLVALQRLAGGPGDLSSVDEGADFPPRRSLVAHRVGVDPHGVGAGLNARVRAPDDVLEAATVDETLPIGVEIEVRVSRLDVGGEVVGGRLDLARNIVASMLPPD